MIITREIINKDIKFHDVDKDGILFSYDYEYLSKAIDLYKKFLLDNGSKCQESATIGEGNTIWQLAALFACYELGIIVVITDYFSTSIMKIDIDGWVDPKTKTLLPINYFLVSKQKNGRSGKGARIKKYVDKILERNFDHDDILRANSNDKVFASPNCIVTKSATSGTTGVPKCIKHTHAFLYSLLCRNSIQFFGKYGATVNLNHGSSIFCYLMPAIISERITDVYNLSMAFHPNLGYIDHVNIINTIEKCGGIDHILVPYASELEKYFKVIKNTNTKATQKTIFHVLCYIKKQWVDEMYKTGKIGDIVSNFGSNETTGPIFHNKASYKNFSETSYKLVDDYFKVTPLKKFLRVHLPVYNKTVTMNDHFIIENNDYIHIGRSDLLRINDLEIPSKIYADIINEFLDGELFYDQIKSEIYLAIWKSSDDIDHSVKSIDKQLRQYSDEKHYISKYSVLDYSTFVNGIKLDKEMVREYFRNFVL